MKKENRMVSLFVILGIVVILIICIICYIKFAPQFGSKTTHESLARVARSEHFRNGKFVNQSGTLISDSDGPPFKAMKEFWTGKADRAPQSDLPIHDVNLDRLLHPQHDNVAITWLGHSSVLIEIDGYSILIDPMFGRSPSPHPCRS